jgi:hypothetical protein
MAVDDGCTVRREPTRKIVANPLPPEDAPTHLLVEVPLVKIAVIFTLGLVSNVPQDHESAWPHELHHVLNYFHWLDTVVKRVRRESDIERAAGKPLK